MKTATMSVRPCLTFASGTEEAVNLYTSVIPGSEIVNIVRSDGSGPVPAGQLLHCTFRIGDTELTAFDGGESFRFCEGFSLVATCETQDELDHVWERLCEGGEPGRCGWLKDRFGLSWQVVPSALGEMLGNASGGNSGKAFEAMLQMSKLDIAVLEAAYQSS